LEKIIATGRSSCTGIGLPNCNDGYLSREELFAWYKRHGYIDNGEKNLSSDIHISIVKQPLEFIVLEKE
jgi:hypothetical protein